jgi:hypothetical protein
MPVAQVRGININDEVLGDTGNWVALSPGGRRRCNPRSPPRSDKHVAQSFGPANVWCVRVTLGLRSKHSWG